MPEERIVWELLAECLTAPPDVFFPQRRKGSKNRTQEAKAYCARCPVIVECLEHGIAEREKHGLWGGAGEPTRRRIARLADGSIENHPSRCRCPYHLAVAAHVAAVRRAYHRDGAVWHGRWEAYVHAGCRCVACSAGQRRHGGQLEPAPDDES